MHGQGGGFKKIGCDPAEHAKGIQESDHIHWPQKKCHHRHYCNTVTDSGIRFLKSMCFFYAENPWQPNKDILENAQRAEELAIDPAENQTGYYDEKESHPDK